MMDFEHCLKILVAQYAYFEEKNFVYQNKKTIDIKEKQEIEASLIALIIQSLLQDGIEETAVDINLKKLRLLFHPDKYPLSSPEIKWLEFTLSDGKVDGTCFKLVDACASNLKKPKSTNTGNFRNITTIDELIVKLERNKELAQTFTQRALIDSVLAMLKTANQYNDYTTNNVTALWAQRLTQLMPYITTGYCIGFFLEELALLYAVTYAVSKSGQWLERSNAWRLQRIGQFMQIFSNSISDAIKALLARLVELNIFVVQGTFNASIDVGSSIYKLLAAPAPIPKQTSINEQSQSLVLAEVPVILSPQDLFGGKHFNTLELKLVAINLEEQAKQLELQWFADWRLGSQKNAAIQRALRNLMRIDVAKVDTETKLTKAEKILEKLASNEVINVTGSKTNHAIKRAQETLRMLLIPNTQEERKQFAICN